MKYTNAKLISSVLLEKVIFKTCLDNIDRGVENIPIPRERIRKAKLFVEKTNDTKVLRNAGKLESPCQKGSIQANGIGGGRNRG